MNKKSAHTLASASGLVACLLAIAPVVIGNGGDRVGKYDFSYRIVADARLRPSQVFDDGQTTYFQFLGGEAIPAIFRVTPQGPIVTTPEVDGPYVKVQGVEGEFLLRMGTAQGRVIYSLAGRFNSAVAREAVATGQAPASQVATLARLAAALPPVEEKNSGLIRTSADAVDRNPLAWTSNSYATPIKGDVTAWTLESSPVSVTEREFIFMPDSSKLTGSEVTQLKGLAKSLSGNYRIEVLGRDDDRHKEGVSDARARNVARALIDAGVPSDRVRLKTSTVVKSKDSGLVVGATVTVRTFPVGAETQANANPVTSPAALPMGQTTASAQDQQMAAVLADLRAGRISPSDAVEQLQRLKSVPAATTARSVPTVAAPAVAVASAVKGFALRKEDRSLDVALKRWAADSGWEVIWNEDVQRVPLTGDGLVSQPSFIQAADFALTQAKNVGYKFIVRAYSDKKLVISQQ